MKKYDYLVVGSGLYGAVFAERAVKSGKRVLVIDKRPYAGGNIRTDESSRIYMFISMALTSFTPTTNMCGII